MQYIYTNKITNIHLFSPKTFLNWENKSFLLLNKAAVKLQINAPFHLLKRNLLVPTALYENFNMPKHLSIFDLLFLNDLHILPIKNNIWNFRKKKKNLNNIKTNNTVVWYSPSYSSRQLCHLVPSWYQQWIHYWKALITHYL